jgi:PAS domain S-box-containing protein
MEKRKYEELNVTLIHQLKKKIEELNEEKERYMQLFEQSNDAILLLDFNGKIFGANKRAKELTGYSEKELLKMNIPQICPKQELDGLRVSFKQTIERGWIKLESQLLAKNQEIKDIEVNSKVIKLKDISFVQAIVRDITEKKRAEEALRESGEKWRSLVENAPNIIIISDKNGKIKFINHTVSGLTVKKTIGTKLYDYIPKEYHTLIKKMNRSVFQTGENGSYEIKGKGPSDRISWYSSQVGPIKKDGKIIAVTTIVTDITERKEAEEKYRILLENLPQKIFFKDRNSVYISCNENYAGDLKIKPDKIKGKTDYDFYPKKLAEKYRADDRRIMKAGKARDIEEGYIQDGKKVFVHTVKVPVKDEKGNVMGILGIFWDITEKKRAEEALRENERKCSKLVKRLKEVKK